MWKPPGRLFSYFLGLSHFPTEISSMVNLIMGINIGQDFWTVYLGNLPSTINVTDKYLIQIILAASKIKYNKEMANEGTPDKGGLDRNHD